MNGMLSHVDAEHDEVPSPAGDRMHATFATFTALSMTVIAIAAGMAIWY